MSAISPQSPRVAARAALLLCLIVPLGFGILALALGQDANWDLRNYHWYNAYAFLNGRLHTDFGASTTYNPALDVPLYLAASALPAQVFSFLLGTIHGLNYIVLYILGRAVFAPLPEPRRTWAAAAIALTGVIGGGHIELVGTSFHDNVVSLAVIGAMVIIARAPAEIFRGAARRTYVRVGLAGLLLGIGVGLKQPTITFAVGLCFAFLLVAGTFWRRMFLAFWFGIGITAGIAVSCGFWMLHLWQDFQNPIYPYFNNIFHSPLGLQEANRDTTYVPQGLFDKLLYPLTFSFHPHAAGEIDFRDFRILAAYLVLIATPLILLARRKASASGAQPMADNLAVRYIIAATVLSFAVWVPLFGIYRYIIPLEMLAPLVAVGAIALWPIEARLRTAFAGVLLIFVSVTASHGDWIRLPVWTHKMVEVTMPPVPEGTMVVMVGLEPLSYVLPSLPPAVPVLRLQGYFMDPKEGDTGTMRLIRARLKDHQGPIYLLTALWDRYAVDVVLPQFNLATDFAACSEVQSNLRPPGADLRIMLCPVTRVDANAAPPDQTGAEGVHP